MGVNWGLSGFFLVAPAYISSPEFKDNNTEFWKVQDEVKLFYECHTWDYFLTNTQERHEFLIKIKGKMIGRFLL